MQEETVDILRIGDSFVLVSDTEVWEAPLALAFDAQGNVVPVVTDLGAQATCRHEGAVYSSNLDVRCPQCGARMFLPPRFLACLDYQQLDIMYMMWEKAGWPEWGDGRWRFNPRRWTVERHSLFEATGGIPVNNDRLEAWREIWTQP
ncbi:MAG: hypothetical protein JXM73_25365 [Anaerolineae bacterium]|nr:hypothetical protein [Anaerolineae bacterium]